MLFIANTQVGITWFASRDLIGTLMSTYCTCVCVVMVDKVPNHSSAIITGMGLTKSHTHCVLVMLHNPLFILHTYVHNYPACTCAARG